MRHRVVKHHFNRDTKHRSSLIKNLLRALVEHGSIVTTQAKAKEVKKQIDKLINMAKKGSLANKRTLHVFFGKRDVVNTLVERVAPLFADKNSGFATISNLGKRRGDNALLSEVALTKKPERNKTLRPPVKEIKEVKKPKLKVEKKSVAKPKVQKPVASKEKPKQLKVDKVKLKKRIVKK